MRAPQTLYKQGEHMTHVYFPHGAIASATKSMDDGRMIEISSVGTQVEAKQKGKA